MPTTPIGVFAHTPRSTAVVPAETVVKTGSVVTTQFTAGSDGSMIEGIDIIVPGGPSQAESLTIYVDAAGDGVFRAFDEIDIPQVDAVDPLTQAPFRVSRRYPNFYLPAGGKLGTAIQGTAYLSEVAGAVLLEDTLLGSGFAGAGGSNSGSQTFLGEAVYLVWVTMSHATAVGDVTDVRLNTRQIAWTQLANVVTGTAVFRGALWGYVPPIGSSFNDTVAITYNGTSANVEYTILRIQTAVKRDLTVGAGKGIPQLVTGTADPGIIISSSLAAQESERSLTLQFAGHKSNEITNEDGSMTEISSQFGTPVHSTVIGAYLNNADTTIDSTWSTSARGVQVVAEFAAVALPIVNVLASDF